MVWDMKMMVLLHNIRSAHNVGSIFRTADAAGVKKLFLTGYTPTPLDRFGRAQKDIAKTALGAQKCVAWEYAKTPGSILKKMKREGVHIVGVEQDARAVNYRSFKPHSAVLFLFGNEVRGLSRSLRDACDTLIEIPMHGTMVRQAHHPRNTGTGKESLNVSVAVGIVLFNVHS